MTRMMRRAVCVLMMAAAALVPGAGAAVAAPGGSATAAACSLAPGDRVSTSWAIFMVSPEGNLYWIPDEKTYYNLWAGTAGVRPVADDVVYACPNWFSMWGAHLAQEWVSGPVYIYDDVFGAYRWIVDLEVFTRYGFAAEKMVRTQVDRVTTPWT